MSLPHAPLPHDTDIDLDSLREELQAVLVSLNLAHHPVHPVPSARVAELEARVADLRAAISERRRQLREAAGA
jgi:hypothetical protein